MAKTKPDIEEFDKLSITDLMQVNNKELTIAIFIKVKQQNGKIKFHDWFIRGLIYVIGIGIVASIIIGTINFFYF